MFLVSGLFNDSHSALHQYFGNFTKYIFKQIYYIIVIMIILICGGMFTLFLMYKCCVLISEIMNYFKQPLLHFHSVFVYVIGRTTNSWCI